MGSFDVETLKFYTREAEAYCAQPLPAKKERLDLFLAALPAGAKILELGCGGGHDSRMMLARGFDVTPTDGSPDMARQAEKLLGRPVAVLPFDQLDGNGIYDAVWANACLLHIPRPGLSAVLSRVQRALKASGVFYASFKAGKAEGRDRFQRYYNYPSSDWLLSQYAPPGWMSVQIDEACGGGYDGEKTDWLHVTAIRTA